MVARPSRSAERSFMRAERFYGGWEPIGGGRRDDPHPRSSRQNRSSGRLQPTTATAFPRVWVRSHGTLSHSSAHSSAPPGRGTVEAEHDANTHEQAHVTAAAQVAGSLRSSRETWTWCGLRRSHQRRTRGPDSDESGRATRAGTGASAGAEAVEPRRAGRAVEL